MLSDIAEDGGNKCLEEEEREHDDVKKEENKGGSVRVLHGLQYRRVVGIGEGLRRSSSSGTSVNIEVGG